MYRFSHHSLTALLLLLSLLSCRKERGDETILSGDFTGKWAEVDQDQHSSSYLDFFMGKCYSYECSGKHRVRDHKMYGCRNMDRVINQISDYHNDGLNSITIGEEVFPFLRITADQVKIGEKMYARFNTFVDDHYKSDQPEQVDFDSPRYTMTLGKDNQLAFHVYPDGSLWSQARWSSDRSDIVAVDSEGIVSAINVGSATITLTLDDIVSTNCIVSVAADLSADGTANSYIVPRQGTWEFSCLYKGNSLEPLPQADSVAVLWESRGGLEDVLPGDIIDNISLSDNKSRVQFTAGKNDGNALIGVFDHNDALLWSWHIWVCKDYKVEEKAQRYRYNAGIMMDRNLGATSIDPDSPKCYGLLYQWGRKDPFPGQGMMDGNLQSKYTLGTVPKTPVDAATGTIDYTTTHPTEFITATQESEYDWIFAERCDTLWSDKKSKFDPCPPGWRVPTGRQAGKTNGVWYTAMNTSETWSRTKAGSHGCLDAKDKLVPSSVSCILPTSGRILSSGAYVQCGTRGFYWSNNQYKDHTPDYLFLIYNSGDSSPFGLYLTHRNWSGNEEHRANAFSVRCYKM